MNECRFLVKENFKRNKDVVGKSTTEEEEAEAEGKEGIEEEEKEKDAEKEEILHIAMKDAIFTLIYHGASTNKKPQHAKSPKDPSSWCFYNAAIASVAIYKYVFYVLRTLYVLHVIFVT